MQSWSARFGQNLGSGGGEGKMARKLGRLGMGGAGGGGGGAILPVQAC